MLGHVRKATSLAPKFTIHRQGEMLVGQGQMGQCQLSEFPSEQYLIGPTVKMKECNKCNEQCSENGAT